jgi:hypothetical protein
MSHTLQTAYHAIVLTHAAIGMIALLTFWSAAIVRKGGDTHRRVGRVYLLAMCGIGATALPMALVQFAKGNPAMGAFLGYLLVITATACARAWFAVRWKREARRYFGAWYRTLAFANIAAGVALLSIGIQHRTALFIGFSSVGIGVGIQMWRLHRAGEPPRWSIREHYRGMIANGVATHVAFLGIGIGRLLPDYASTAQMLAWFGPLAVSLLAGAYLKRRYGTPRAAMLSKPRAAYP